MKSSPTGGHIPTKASRSWPLARLFCGVEQYDVQGDTINIYAPIQMVPLEFYPGIHRYGHRDQRRVPQPASDLERDLDADVEDPEPLANSGAGHAASSPFKRTRPPSGSAPSVYV